MSRSFLLSLLFAFVLIGHYLSAQSDTQTLFGGGSSVSTEHLGFFVAPAFGLSSMDGGVTSLFNLRGGLNFKDRFSVGGYLSTAFNEINPESESVTGVYMDYKTVGGFAEYTLMSKKTFHVTFPLFIGFGEVQMDNEDGDVGLGEANFFQIEPSAMLEVNLHKYVRFNLGVGYRIVGQMDYRNFNQSDISGLTSYVGLRFGLFR